MDKTIKPLKVAVISDSQAYPTLNDWGMNNLSQALQFFAAMKPDVLLMAGDLADGTDYATFKFYRQLIEKYFDPVPVHIGCAGNHDYWVPRGCQRESELIYSKMSSLIGQRTANPLRETVGGYDFIAMSEDIDSQTGYSPEMLDALENEIKAAVARDAEKPVFVITHFHPADTVAGSHVASARPELRKLFNRYKQVISLSGHTHCPLEDERCIWQGEFTAVNTSTLAYGCVEEKCYNNCSVIIPFAREVRQAMFMEIYPEHIDIHRYNTGEDREIKPDHIWRLPIPYRPELAAYTAERKQQRTAPEFPAGASGVIRYDFGYLYLIFDQALHEDFTHFYDIKVYEKNGSELILKAEERYISDFYRQQGIAGRQLSYKLPGELITPGCELHVEVYPVESFGNTGKPLIVERKIPCPLKYKEGKPLYPQE